MEVMYDRVMLKKIEAATTTSSGFYIASDESVRATVVKIGNGRISNEGVRIKPEVKIGDVVIFNVSSAIPVVLNKETFLVIKEEAILAVVDPD